MPWHTKAGGMPVQIANNSFTVEILTTVENVGAFANFSQFIILIQITGYGNPCFAGSSSVFFLSSHPFLTR